MSIPASTQVSVNPSVLSAGGNPLALNGLVLSESTELPIGPPVSFPSAAAVSDYFGPTSIEAMIAAQYFSGYVNCTQLPSALLFFRYAAAATSGFLRGAVNTATLAAIKAITAGSLAVTVDGAVFSSAAINLSASTSLADAASRLGTALSLSGGAAITFDTVANAFVLTSGSTGVTSLIGIPTSATSSTVGTATFATNVMTVVSGTGFAPGQLVVSAGVAVGTTILQQTSGTTGTTGTYTLSSAPGTITPAQSAQGLGYGTVAALLKLDSAAGSASSPGAAATTPAATMASIVNATQNWVGFMTTFEPSLADEESFAAWASGTNGRYYYACWTTDITATQTPSSYVGIANYASTNLLSGIATFYPDVLLAAFDLGITASTDFGRRSARITHKFKSSSLPITQVTDQTSYANLKANGVNCYGSFATANQPFVYEAEGAISGPYKFIDSYVNAVWFTNQCQLALMELVTNIGSIPYNKKGYGLIKAALQDPVNQGFNFGMMQKGVTLSAAQAAEVNAAAGLAIDGDLFANGVYVQVLDPGAQARGNRTTPQCTIWYMDGQSVHQITVASIDIL